MRRILTSRETKLDSVAFGKLHPQPRRCCAKKIEMTGKSWTLDKYAMLGDRHRSSIVGGLLWLDAGLRRPLLALFVGRASWASAFPNFLINRLHQEACSPQFTAKFPDAIELLVRGLRSGLPISETLGRRRFGGAGTGGHRVPQPWPTR